MRSVEQRLNTLDAIKREIDELVSLHHFPHPQVVQHMWEQGVLVHLDVDVPTVDTYRKATGAAVAMRTALGNLILGRAISQVLIAYRVTVSE